MSYVSRFSSLSMLVIFLSVGTAGAAAASPARAAASNDPQESRVIREPVSSKPHLDRSGRTRVGKASFYAKMFSGRKMADGTPMHPRGDNAASKTLPLGTTAKVTNLETGKSAVVTIRDRGPYVKGRIVDLSPATAQKIGLSTDKGVTNVVVAPILVPLADGKLKLGAAVTASNQDEGGSDEAEQVAAKPAALAWSAQRDR